MELLYHISFVFLIFRGTSTLVSTMATQIYFVFTIIINSYVEERIGQNVWPKPNTIIRENINALVVPEYVCVYVCVYRYIHLLNIWNIEPVFVTAVIFK